MVTDFKVIAVFTWFIAYAENISILKKDRIIPGKLPNVYVSVDIDITPFDNSNTKKQDVSRTYKGCDDAKNIGILTDAVCSSVQSKISIISQSTSRI